MSSKGTRERERYIDREIVREVRERERYRDREIEREEREMGEREIHR